MTLAFDAAGIDAIFASLNQPHLPGAAVGIAMNGEVVYRKGFGLANMELPVALSPAIRMRVASITKQFTCLAYLLLCEEGRASLDEPIGTFLPELHAVTRRLTVRDLMSHSSGARDVHDIRYQFSGTGTTVSVAQLLDMYRDIDSVNFAPGTSWNYNNGGYLMLSVAIERIANRPLEDVLRHRVFEAVGMADTLLRRWDDSYLANSAALHMPQPTGGFCRNLVAKEHVGEGGVVSTVDDMLRWMTHLRSSSVGSVATWAAMRTPRTLANGVSTGYGLGLRIARYRGVDTLSHAGGLMGCNSIMLSLPTVGLDIVVLSNRHDVVSSALANRIVDACIPGLDPADEAPQPPLVTGVFGSREVGPVVQLLCSQGRQAVFIDGTVVLAVAGRDGHFTLGPNQSLRLSRESSRPSTLRFQNYGTVEELTAMPPATRTDVAAIVGRYRWDAADIEATICDPGRMDTMSRLGHASYRLECIAENIWRASSDGAMPWGGVLRFDPDAGFWFSSARTRALPFRRVV